MPAHPLRKKIANNAKVIVRDILGDMQQHPWIEKFFLMVRF